MPTFTLDHLLVYGDVDRVAAEVERMLGARPDDGGTHPGRGTRNLLYAMGGEGSLELIGPDPSQDLIREDVPSAAEDEPVLWWWAVRTEEPLVQVCARLRAQGFVTTDPAEGARIRPAGDTVRWESLDLIEHPFGTALPFVIRWTDGTPPFRMAASPSIRLASFRVGAPDRDGLAAALDRIGVAVEVGVADRPSLEATVSSPTGTARFTSR